MCLLMAAISGCAHRTLIAPCDGNVGTMQLDGMITPTGDSAAVLPASDCGPLKPVNLPPVTE
jgi:hypothetical protein